MTDDAKEPEGPEVHRHHHHHYDGVIVKKLPEPIGHTHWHSEDIIDGATLEAIAEHAVGGKNAKHIHYHHFHRRTPRG